MSSMESFHIYAREITMFRLGILEELNKLPSFVAISVVLMFAFPGPKPVTDLMMKPDSSGLAKSSRILSPR